MWFSHNMGGYRTNKKGGKELTFWLILAAAPGKLCFISALFFLLTDFAKSSTPRCNMNWNGQAAHVKFHSSHK